MSPTVLLADPALRLAGVPAPTHRVERAAPALHPRGIVACTLLVVAFGMFGYLRTWPPLATVMSASMAPTINTGDVVVLGRLGRPARVGDVAVIHVPDDARSRYGYPDVVTHRVVAIAPDG